MVVINGYKWTLIDVVFALIPAYFFGNIAISLILQEGITLATVAGALWGYGTIMFILVYPFPIFGGPVERIGLSQRHTALPMDESKRITGRGYFNKMNSRTLKCFFIFFITAGGMTIVGIFTNT